MAMIHPLLRLAATEPHLLGDHVEAYAALVGEEVGRASTSWVTRIGLYAVALAMVVVGLVLVGVALLLASTIPANTYPAMWGLIAVPVAPFLIALICIVIARSRPSVSAFDKVKTQLNADMAMLREVSAA